MTRSGPGLALPTTADGRPILSRADLERYDPHGQRSGGRERYYCPMHGGDHQRSLSVDPKTGLYTCHTCHARGQLREFWPTLSLSASGRAWRPTRLTAEETGRRVLEGARRTEQDRCTRLAGIALPRGASAFLARLPEMADALRRLDCPGSAYLRRRGLDPQLAVELGTGYAPPDFWPGDRGRKAGRVVYPLADPATGHVVSALGRLCQDEDPTWRGEQRALFRRVKQRKLKDCPAGVWPYASLSGALAARQPLVLVEGPADALTLLAASSGPLHVMALVGTANVLPATLLRELPGVVLAFDDDEPGRDAARALRAALAIAGVPAVLMPAGWLGDGVKDPADLAALDQDRALTGAGRGAHALGGLPQALGALHAACAHLTGHAGPFPWIAPAMPASAEWDEEAACALLTGLYQHCAAACAHLPADAPWPRPDPVLEAALDAAVAAHDWAALQAAVSAQAALYGGDNMLTNAAISIGMTTSGGKI